MDREINIMDLIENRDIQKLKELANEGDLNAQYNLSVCYTLGHGVKIDYSEAISWLKKAAYGGHVPAQYSLLLRWSGSRCKL